MSDLNFTHRGETLLVLFLKIVIFFQEQQLRGIKSNKGSSPGRANIGRLFISCVCPHHRSTNLHVKQGLTARKSWAVMKMDTANSLCINNSLIVFACEKNNLMLTNYIQEGVLEN